ncbi:MAG: ABC transporter substrate-binding protein [Dehalococcoidia bacterium]|nr:MAG: ABC transporter substrate-binding protein [Dehalococcoidia bacterium]
MEVVVFGRRALKTWPVFISVLAVLVLLLACAAPQIPAVPELPPETTPATPTSSGKYLTPNPAETHVPIYGGTLLHAINSPPRSLDAHQLVGYGPTVTLPVFNQLVMFDLSYKETVPETIIGDLAESWETSPDGLSITFKLRQGVRWHDGMPFTADDVVYSLDKMTDVNRSAIKDWFPAYSSTEKIDEYTVKVYLKYASAGFMLALAQGEAQIQSWRLAGTDHQSTAFAVGTGPFVLAEYLQGVHLKYQRNPDYWKKDEYGNQLPYLDCITLYIISNTAIHDALIARRLDMKGTVTGSAGMDTYNVLKNGAPELLWQRRDRYNGYPIYLNTKMPPLDDIRVRRALGLVLVEEDVIVGGCGDVMFGLTDAGIIHPAWGLPKEDVKKLMGWDKPYEERAAEAQRLMTEAGYPNGFKMTMLSSTGTTSNAALVFAEALRTKLKIDVEVISGIGTIELFKRVEENRYHSLSWDLTIMDPVQLANFFGTDGYANYSNYSNPELDKILENLDHILDPDQRREAIWQIDRILLTDLPALPTGLFPANIMPYYPHVKNLRFNYISYSNINRLEDVWIDESFRVK